MLMTILLLSVLLLVTAAAAAATAARLGEATPVVVAMGEDPTSASGGADVPSWDDLDRRPLPPWYDSAKFGIFIHWGVFSVPSFTSEWFWNYWHEPGDDVRSAAARFVKETEAPGFVYQEYANRFRAELYNASDWAQVFAASGAQYVVLTSKHHEGFAMWNSTPNVPATWNWNAVDVGPKRDVLGELAEAVKRSKSPHTSNLLKFGVYHSLYEWYNPLYLRDKASNFTRRDFVDLKTMPELYDLVERYRPELVWSDGEWEAPSDYWKSREFLHWYSTQSPVASTAVWNDRWGSDTLCKHGGFLTCTDRYMPGSVVGKKWEDCLTIDKNSWGYNRKSQFADYMTVPELVRNLITAASRNGNMLLNVGPASDGTIHPIFVDRLLGIGEWLKVNGEAIYNTTIWKVCQNETISSVFYTRTRDTLYAHTTEWPTGGILELDCPIGTSSTRARILGLDPSSSPLMVVRKTQDDGNPRAGTAAASSSSVAADASFSGLTVQLPSLTPDIIPCQHAWVIALTGIANLQ